MLLSTVDCLQTTKTATTDNKVSEKTEQSMAEKEKIVGQANIMNYTEAKLVRDLYELRDTENLLTYTYIIDMNGIKHFLGRSIGFGIPASVQFTNPHKIIDPDDIPGQTYYSGEGTPVLLGQSEPNGLFMPDGLSATWVFLLDAEGTPRPVYIEPLIMVSPFKLH